MPDVAVAPELTPEIAVAVLNAAMQGATPGEAGMYPAGAVPEKDNDKVSEAQKIIALAQQAKVVADQIGHSNVPMWPVIERVLREAKVYQENGTAPGPAQSQTQALPAAAAGLQEAADATGVGMVGSSFTDPPGVEYHAQPGGDGPVQVASEAQGRPIQETLPPAASQTEMGAHIPPATVEPSSPGPQEGQRWLDANGNEWDIRTYAGGPQLEAVNVQTGEATTLPAGFLKQPSPNQPAPVQTQEVQPSAPPSPLPSSPPSPPVSPAAAPTAPGLNQPVAPAATSGSPSPPSSSQPQEQASPSLQSPPVELAEPPLPAPVDDDEGDEKYGDLLDQVTADYTPIGMPVPMDLERAPSPMPDDLTSIAELPARALHSQFNALAARARYLNGLEAAKARACERIYKYNLKGAMRAARAELGKDASVTEVQQLAEDDENVEPWMRRRDRHSDRAKAYGTFLTMYSEDVSVLSRDWTMREKEQQGS